MKIRGFRIELGEIEARLAEHAEVRGSGGGGAGGRARGEAAGGVLHVRERREVGSGRSSCGSGAAARAPEGGLPEYMVPAAYVRLERLPLTPNGKLDRKALPAPDGDAYAVRGYEAPLGEIEETLAGIWAEVLKVERVGRHDNFFELGGHSLLAVTLIERMRRAGLQADVRALFATPTLAGLAAAVEVARRQRSRCRRIGFRRSATRSPRRCCRWWS